MTILVFKIITHTVQLTTITACAWYLWKENSRLVYRVLAAGWMVVLLYDLTMVVIGLINPLKNHWVYNIAFPLMQLFSMWFLILLLVRRKFYLLMGMFAVFVVYNITMLQGPTILNTFSLALGGLVILLLASIKMTGIYKQDTVQSLFEEPDFWVCNGLILYWALATPFFAMYNFLWSTYPDFFTFYFFTVSFGFTTVLNLCIIKALQCSLNTVKR